LNNIESGSVKENILFENLQILNYYLSNILYTLQPALEQAARFMVVRQGKFSNLEEFEKGLRYDKVVRNLNVQTF
jgi:hypothetical protein